MTDEVRVTDWLQLKLLVYEDALNGEEVSLIGLPEDLHDEIQAVYDMGRLEYLKRKGEQE